MNPPKKATTTSRNREKQEEEGNLIGTAMTSTRLIKVKLSDLCHIQRFWTRYFGFLLVAIQTSVNWCLKTKHLSVHLCDKMEWRSNKRQTERQRDSAPGGNGPISENGTCSCLTGQPVQTGWDRERFIYWELSKRFHHKRKLFYFNDAAASQNSTFDFQFPDRLNWQQNRNWFPEL